MEDNTPSGIINNLIKNHITQNKYIDAYNVWKINKHYVDEKIGFDICLKLGKVVSYKINDRLGNKLFVYFAAKIIAYNNDCHFFPYKYVENNKENNIGSFGIMTNLTDHLIKNKTKLDITPNVCNIINDWCQYDTILQHSLPRSIFNEYNYDVIENNTRICDIYNEIVRNKYEFNHNDIVLHLRLSDFNHGQIITYQSIQKLLDSLQWNKLYIVCKKPKEAYETTYINNFSKYNPTVLNGNLYEDISKIYYAPRLICSNSTLCWMIGSLGINHISWSPVNKSVIPLPSIYTHREVTYFIWHNYMLHQNIKKINFNCEEYEI